MAKLNNHSEHGTTISYVIGFALSLIFTVIPYFLVTKNIMSRDGRLYTILGFALVQMCIQLFFFLHLGRGPKPLYNVIFSVAAGGLIVVVVVGSMFIMDNLYQNMSADEATLRYTQEEGIAAIGDKSTGACQGNGQNHKVTIENGIVTPKFTEAFRCDTLTIINKDKDKYELRFGAHDHHESYGGEFEYSVSNIRPESIVLNQTGMFSFHNHDNPDSSGSFSVIE